MYHIALCDDDTEELDRMESILRLYLKQHEECDFSIERFNDAEELLWMVREKGYSSNLLFIDIYMPGLLGIDAAKELREMGSVCQIVFLTTSKEFALEAFSVDALQYLVKPFSEEDIFRILDRFRQEIIEEERKYLMLKVDGTIRKIALRNIVYCEAQKKHQYIYMIDGTQLLLSMSMAKLSEMLSDYREFVKVGVSYIVNLEHIVGLSAKELQMESERKLYLPRGAHAKLREQYFDYYFWKDKE